MGIFAHKVILAACSNYFRAMFTGELAESRQTEVTIREVDEAAMEILIDFCYTSHIAPSGLPLTIGRNTRGMLRISQTSVRSFKLLGHPGLCGYPFLSRSSPYCG